MTANVSFRVLVATDGSDVARRALATVLRFPWPVHASASGLVATPLPAAARSAIWGRALDETAERVAAHTTRALARRWPHATVRLSRIEPVEAILREAARVHADLIVVGWRGHGPVRRLLAGSVSRGVVRRAPCAVLVVRHTARAVRHIVVGVDGSSDADRAVALVARLSPPPRGRVTLVTAVPQMPTPAHALAPVAIRRAVAAETRRINTQEVARAKQHLEHVSRRVTAAGWRVRTVVTTGAPLRGLLSTVVTPRADLLVVGARGVTGLQRVLLGSVTEGALNRSPVPVIIAR